MQPRQPYHDFSCIQSTSERAEAERAMYLAGEIAEAIVAVGAFFGRVARAFAEVAVRRERRVARVIWE